VNDSQLSFLAKATAQAVKANLRFPEMWASEAALESSWGNSLLSLQDNNLFGTKQHCHPIYGTMNLPTKEWVRGPDGHPVDGRWIQVMAKWIVYPDWRACFADRLVTLERLSNAYPHYKAALDAPDAKTYVTEVSKSWSTDSNRATKVISIYEEYLKEKNGGSVGTQA
jgi:flagellum-specific peptidoglycan hydrolase FlgJ